MSTEIRWSVVLACPAEEELALLADLASRRDARIVAVADPVGGCIGGDLAEIMGIPVVSDLGGIGPDEVDWLVYSGLNDAVAALVDEATAKGIASERSDVFAQRLAAPGRPVAPREPLSGPDRDLEALERETSSIHRTLSRIEEALDRESLLRWLLGLAMRAVGAGSGSLMLWDDAAGELYVGFAHGLSDATRHTTRVKSGEGIAGRVVATGEATRVRKRGTSKGRDRSDIVDAVCAPLRWEGHLLGVVNLSTTGADGPMGEDALGVVNGLSHRLASLLERFLSLQATQDQQKLRALDQELGTVALTEDAPRDFLASWLGRFATAADAAYAELGLLTADGDLCLVTPAGVDYEAPPAADRAAVLATGLPRVRRVGDTGAESVYHLPVGRDGRRAVLTVGFKVPAAAHRFGALADTYVYLANRHLSPALTLGERTDEVERLTLLASALSSLAELRGSDAEAHVLAAAKRLTGAGSSLLVDDRAPAGDDPDADLKVEAARLLRQLGDAGWVATTLETGNGRHSALVVPLDTTRPLPGLLLLDKSRVHDLDSATFTETDARFARRLLPLLRTQGIDTEPSPAPTTSSGGTSQVIAILRREMDRCDRYHTMLGVAAFRLDRTPGPTVVSDLAGMLRSSDQVGCLDDGTLVVVVPEEIQSLHRLQQRVKTLLTTLAGPGAQISSGSVVYPGPAADPDQLLAAALRNCS